MALLRKPYVFWLLHFCHSTSATPNNLPKMWTWHAKSAVQHGGAMRNDQANLALSSSPPRPPPPSQIPLLSCRPRVDLFSPEIAATQAIAHRLVRTEWPALSLSAEGELLWKVSSSDCLHPSFTAWSRHTSRRVSGSILILL